MTNCDKHEQLTTELWPVGRRVSSQCNDFKNNNAHSSKMLEYFTTKVFIVAGVVAFVSLLLTSAGILPNKTPVVPTENGPVQGRTDYSRIGKKYFSYSGIPFARPPIGDLRFEPPEPLNETWKDVRDATSYPPYCLQLDVMVKGRILGQEDCLYLNVFTHEFEKKRPVIVYLHGGGFASGSSHQYQPDYFMDREEIVLVVINYRLGPLGFLNLGNGVINGNFGLKDQNLALHWVQKNIARFGGDPNRVTLMGESAGAASVQYHMLSPASKGLFHRAIMQSGTVICPWSFMNSPSKVASSYLEHINCPSGNTSDLVHCLKTVSSEKLVEHLLIYMSPILEFLRFVPSVEPETSKNAFLTRNPRQMLKEGKISNTVPVLAGVTSGEGALRTARLDAMPEAIPEFDMKWERYAPTLLGYDHTEPDTVATKIREYYFGNNSFTKDVHEFKKNFTKMMSDAYFYEPLRRSAKLYAQQGQPIYMYYYDYNSVFLPSIYSFLRAVRPDDWIFAEAKIAVAIITDLLKENIFESDGPHDFNVSHADDLFQLWNMEGISRHLSGPDAEFSNSFVKAMVDFAVNEEPLQFAGVKWPPIQSRLPDNETPLQYMLLGKNPAIISEPFADRMAFWESLHIRNSRK